MALSCLCVRLPFVRMEQIGQHWTNFLKFHTWLFFQNLLRKFNFNWNMIRITGSLHEDICNDNIPFSCCYNKCFVQSFSEKCYTQFILNTLMKILSLWVIVWKYCFARHITDDNALFSQITEKPSSNFFRKGIQISLRDMHFLFSADFPELNVINIKLNVFMHNLFFYLCVKFTSCLPPSYGLFPLLLQLKFVSMKMYR